MYMYMCFVKYLDTQKQEARSDVQPDCWQY